VKQEEIYPSFTRRESVRQ